jgi:hypothetical protein
MGLYEVMVFVHVTAAVTLLSGSVVASPAVRGSVRRAGTTQEMRAYLAIGGPLLILEPTSALVVLASGIYLTSVANFWAQGWVQAAIAFWIVNAVVAGVVVKPVIGHVVAAAATAIDGPVDQHLDTFRRSSRWSVGGDVLMANDIAMLYVMTMKPDLAGSLLAVAGTILAIGAVRVITRGLHGFIVSRHSVEPPSRAARL